MAIFLPKGHNDGSSLGMNTRSWSFSHISSSFVSDITIKSAIVSSSSLGLTVDNRPFIVSPFTVDELSGLGEGIVPIRLNNLMPASDNYSLDGNLIRQSGLPIQDGDLVNKLYVDNAVQGLKWKQSVVAASVDKGKPQNLFFWREFVQSQFIDIDPGPNTVMSQDPSAPNSGYGHAGWIYASGSSGEGATLTWDIPIQSFGQPGTSDRTRRAINLTLTSGEGDFTFKTPSDPNGTTSYNAAEYMFDSVYSLQIDSRVLIKDFQDPGKNGIYIVQHTGSVPAALNTASPANTHPDYAARPVLVRSLDFNTGSEISSAAVFVEEGILNSDLSYVVTTNSSSIANQPVGDFPIDWSLNMVTGVDSITIYKDIDDNERLEVTGTLRDINDLTYDYAGGGTFSFTDPEMGSVSYLDGGTSGRVEIPDGTFIVGDGTSWTLERDNTARTTLGLGTGSLVVFDSLTLQGRTPGNDSENLRGSLTTSFLVGHPENGNILTLSSHLSGTQQLSIQNIVADTTVNANTFDGPIGNIDNVNSMRVTSDHITASISLSASYMQLRSFETLTNYSSNPNHYPLDSSLFNVDGVLRWQGLAIAGGNALGGQEKENVEFWGGNIYSNNDGAGLNPVSDTFIRIGVSGSNEDGTRAGTTDRDLDLQVIEGSFKWLTGSNVDINGGTIDGTSIGDAAQSSAKFTTLDVNSTFKIRDSVDNSITGSQAKFDRFETALIDIDGGTIDGTIIGDTTPAAGTFTNLNAGRLDLTPATNHNIDFTPGQIFADRIGAGTFNPGTYSFAGSTISAINELTASAAVITHLTASSALFTELTASDVDINGGTLDDVTITNANISVTKLSAPTGSFTLLSSSHFILKDDLEIDPYLDIDLGGATTTSYIKGINQLIIETQELTASRVDINAGDIDGVYLGKNSPVIELTASNVMINEVGGAKLNQITSSLVHFGSAPGTLGSFQIGGEVNHGATFLNQITGSKIVTNDLFRLDGNLTASSDNPARSNEPDGKSGASFDDSYNIDFSYNRLQKIRTPLAGANRSGHLYDAVNRRYIDNLSIKKTVRFATNDQGNFNTAFNPPQNLDGVSISVGDHVLIYGRSSVGENGIFEIQNSGAPLKVSDWYPQNYGYPGEPGVQTGGALIGVLEGDNNGQSIWMCTDPIGTQAHSTVSTFVKVSQSTGTVTSGHGLTKIGNVISASLNDGLADQDNPLDRANLAFNTDGNLILSASIVVDSLTVASGTLKVNPTFGGTIDSVVIGANDPDTGTFTTLSANIIEVPNVISSSTGAIGKIIVNSGSFDDRLVVNNIFETLQEDTNSGESSFKLLAETFLFSNNLGTKPGFKEKRLYIHNDDLYFENIKLAEGGLNLGTNNNTIFTPDYAYLYITGSRSDGHKAHFSSSLVIGEVDNIVSPALIDYELFNNAGDLYWNNGITHEIIHSGSQIDLDTIILNENTDAAIATNNHVDNQLINITGSLYWKNPNDPASSTVKILSGSEGGSGSGNSPFAIEHRDGSTATVTITDNKTYASIDLGIAQVTNRIITFPANAVSGDELTLFIYQSHSDSTLNFTTPIGTPQDQIIDFLTPGATPKATSITDIPVSSMTSFGFVYAAAGEPDPFASSGNLTHGLWLLK